MEASVESFLKSPTEVSDHFRSTKIYEHEEDWYWKYKEFRMIMEQGNSAQEKWGLLQVRFLSPPERQRLNQIVQSLGIHSLWSHVTSGGFFMESSSGYEQEITELVNYLLTQEINEFAFGSLQTTLNFINKVLCIACNKDEALWEKITREVMDLKSIREGIFRRPMSILESDSGLSQIQAVDEFNLKKTQRDCGNSILGGSTNDFSEAVGKYLFRAETVLPRFKETVESIVGRDNYSSAPLKNLYRIQAKCTDKESTKTPLENLEGIFDYVRGTVACRDAAALRAAYDKILSSSSRGRFEVVRTKNGFKKMHEDGYKSILVNILFDDSLICEVQLTVAPMKATSTLDHFLYEAWRETHLWNFVARYTAGSFGCYDAWLLPYLSSQQRVQGTSIDGKSSAKITPEPNDPRIGYYEKKGGGWFEGVVWELLYENGRLWLVDQFNVKAQCVVNNKVRLQVNHSWGKVSLEFNGSNFNSFTEVNLSDGGHSLWSRITASKAQKQRAKTSSAARKFDQTVANSASKFEDDPSNFLGRFQKQGDAAKKWKFEFQNKQIYLIDGHQQYKCTIENKNALLVVHAWGRSRFTYSSDYRTIKEVNLDDGGKSTWKKIG